MEEAVYSGDLGQVQALIRSGADVNEALIYIVRLRSGTLILEYLLPYEDCLPYKGSLLHLAIEEGYTDIALALLAAGADVHAKDKGGWTGLHWACCKGVEEVVQALIDRGSRVNERSYGCNYDGGQTPLMVAADKEGHDAISLRLLRAGASCEGLSISKVQSLLLHACNECDELAVRNLFKNGYKISLLSEEEQKALLLSACREDKVFVARTLIENDCSIRELNQADLLYLVHNFSEKEREKLLCLAYHEGSLFAVYTLLKNGCSVSNLSREKQEELLHCACHEGDAFGVEALLDSGCNMNCVNALGYTPLMNATEKGHEEIVKKLILAGANLRMQGSSGDTALHIAAASNNIQCGILLAEGGASVRTKNNLAQTPLDLAKAEFKVATKQALSFTTRKALCIIGNAEGGKSTLIAALQAEKNSFLGKMVNRLKRVNDRRQRTAGIEIVPHCSKRYGEVLFFDFAGQHEYHGPHQMFMESLLSKPGVSMTFLLVVKMTEQEDAILHQLHRWLSPVALMATPASPPHVIIIGSFLDKVKSKKEATAKLTRCMEATKKDLEELPLEFVGSTFLNCRQPQSAGIDYICKFLQEIPIPEFRAAHTRYSLAWVLSQIRSSFTAQAVELQEFSKWVQDNKDNLPWPMPPPEEVCLDLSAAGHGLYLPNREDPPKSWLVLDLPSILHDVYGTLFSQCREIVNEIGLLHCRHLAELFPHLDLEMVQQLLISLEFCLPVGPLILKVDMSELTHSEENSGWLFFPALISANHPQSTLASPIQQSVRYLCWQLRTSKKHSISARLLQTILLRLAAHFVVKQNNEEGVQQHCCSIWWNGISWQSRKGLDITVHIVNNRVIQVMGASRTSADKSCQYLTKVICDILSTVHRLSPKLSAGAYIVHPPKMSASSECITAPSPKELFPMEGIRSAVRDNDEDSLSLKDNITDRCTTVAVSDLFGGYTPSLEDIERICWMQPEANQTQSSRGTSQPDVLSQTVFTCERYPILFRTYVSRPSAGKGRAVLEGIGLAPETIRACYGRHPLEEEEAVQDGLIKWAEGHHGYSCTWRVLLSTMEYAGVAQHHCQGLKEELYEKLADMPANPSQPHLLAEQIQTKCRRSMTEPLVIQGYAQAHHVSSQSLTLPNEPDLYPEENSVPTDSTTNISGARALLDVSSTPDMQDVDELVVTEVAANWQRVALRLGVEGCLRKIILKNHPNDCMGACHDMLNCWLRRDQHTGEGVRSWSTLLTALGTTGSAELERRLRRQHFHK